MPDADWVLYRQLRGKPLPTSAELLGTTYELEKTLKRDFYAATGIYRRVLQQPQPAQVLLKIYHTGPLGKLRLRWLGRWLCAREVKYLRAVDGIAGVPRFLARYRSSGLVREFIPGCNLREYLHTHHPQETFFPTLQKILAQVHARGVSHNDLSKPENILVDETGAPLLIDFQIALTYHWMFRALQRYMQGVDRYHLEKLHRRYRPEDFEGNSNLARQKKGVLLTLHGWLLRRPYRAVRHLFLRQLREEQR